MNITMPRPLDNGGLCIPKHYAQCYEAIVETNNEPMLRVYWSSPRGLTVQVRTFAGIGNSGKSGKPRNMIAHVELNAAEAKQLRAALDEFIARTAAA